MIINGIVHHGVQNGMAVVSVGESRIPPAPGLIAADEVTLARVMPHERDVKVVFHAPLELDGERVGALEVIQGVDEVEDVTGDYTGMEESGESFVVMRTSDGTVLCLNALRHGAGQLRRFSGAEVGEDIQAALDGVERVTLECENGVSLDDCTRVHRQLSDLLDVHDPIPWRYTLEVSSPGINRPLLRPSHYRRYLGQPIRLRAKTAHNSRRVFVGPLCQVEEEHIGIVDQDVGNVHIAWEDIAHARVDLPPPLPSKDPQKKKRKGRRREMREKLCNQT